MKIVLLGLTGSGKSTTAPKLADHFKLNLLEADDEVIRHNKGIWPKDEGTIDKSFKTTNAKVLTMDNILYVISWLNKEWLSKFAKAGFNIIELHADMEELIKRKKRRDNVQEKELERFRKNYDDYFKVMGNPAIASSFSLSLDTTNLSPEETYFRIVANIKS